MRLENEERSQNVEDRRGFRMSRGVAGGAAGRCTGDGTAVCTPPDDAEAASCRGAMPGLSMDDPSIGPQSTALVQGG